jgi:hypothetical protein
MVIANRSIKSSRSQELDLEPVKIQRSPYKASWFAQLRAVMWRSFLSIRREPAVLKVKAFQTIVIEIFLNPHLLQLRNRLIFGNFCSSLQL